MNCLKEQYSSSKRKWEQKFLKGKSKENIYDSSSAKYGCFNWTYIELAKDMEASDRDYLIAKQTK